MSAGASLLMAGASLGGGLMEASSAANQGKFEKQQAEFNARLSEIKAEDALARGEKDARSFKREAEQFKGKQTAAMAAQGVDINSASFAAIKKDTETLSAFDEMEIRNNAWREAWGLKSEAANYRTQGKFAAQAGKAKSRSALLTGGLNAIGYGAEAYGEFKGLPKDEGSGASGGGGSIARSGINRITTG